MCLKAVGSVKLWATITTKTKQEKTYRKGSNGNHRCCLWYPGEAAEDSPFFLPTLRQAPVLFLQFFPPLVWMENDVLAEERKRAGLECLDNPVDQSAIDMPTIYCFDPIGFCSQHTAVHLLVGWTRTSHFEITLAPEEEQEPVQCDLLHTSSLTCSWTRDKQKVCYTVKSVRSIFSRFFLM